MNRRRFLARTAVGMAGASLLPLLRAAEKTAPAITGRPPRILLRGSYNEGFRAPSFFQLYGAQGEAPVPGNIADPVL